MIRSSLHALAAAVVATTVSLLPATTAAPAAAAPTWAPSSSATVHPGVQTYTQGSQCTANFVFTDGSRTFLGQAAHCAGTGSSTETNGCTAGTLPEGTPVEIEGASRPGVMVYSSWARMQQLGETDPNTCAFNDLALVELAPEDVAVTNPSVPVYGGPVAVRATGLSSGESVYSYGNSSLRFGLTATSPKRGVSDGDAGDGWSHDVTFTNPGVPGDSGSGLLDSAGNAAGVLSTVGVGIPSGVTNQFGDLAHELSWLSTRSGFGTVSLVPGTDAFHAGGGLLGGLGLLFLGVA